MYKGVEIYGNCVVSVTIFFKVPFPILLCFLLIEVLLNTAVSVEKCYISFQEVYF